jgi:hypothetical protein
MHTDVSTIHKSSQKMLNGKPKIMGKTRSHADTEKHIAKKGISASRIVAREGLLTGRAPDECGRAPDKSVGIVAYCPSSSHTDLTVCGKIP